MSKKSDCGLPLPKGKLWLRHSQTHLRGAQWKDKKQQPQAVTKETPVLQKEEIHCHRSDEAQTQVSIEAAESSP